MSRKRKNAGEGYGYMFHGAFKEKKDAVAKERKTKGAWVKGVYTKNGHRYLVMSPRTNPIKRKKKNPTELLVMGANPADLCGAMVQGNPCTRKRGHRGPHLPQGATLRPRSRTPRSWQENPGEMIVPPGTTITIRTNPTELRDNAGFSFHPGLLTGRQQRAHYGRVPFNRRVAAMVRKAKRAAEPATLERAYERHRAGRGGRVRSGGSAKLNKLFHELYARNPGLGLNPGDDKWMRLAAQQLYPGKDLRQLEWRELSKVAQLAAQLKRDAGVGTRWNPSAAAIRESFTGMPADEMAIENEPHMPAGDYAQLGELLALYVKPHGGGPVQQMNFRQGSRPLLVSDESARQLWFVGGDQDLTGSLDTFGPRERKPGLLELGEARRLDYKQRKEHVPHPDVDEWRHELGEETGVRPVLLFDTKTRRMLLQGGEYQVRPEGIVN